MTAKRWWIGGLVLLGICLMFTVHGVILPKLEHEQQQASLRQQHPLTHDISQVLSYRHPYMGNASNLSNLFGALPLQELRRTFRLDSEQYVAELHFEVAATETEELLLKQSLIYNATAAFALIDNLQTVRFQFLDRGYSVNRANVEQWYGERANQLAVPDVWQEHVQSKLHDQEYVDLCAQAILQQIDRI